MKKNNLATLTIILSFVLMVTGIKLYSVNAETNSIKIFSDAETEELGIKLIMEKNEVEKILGKPTKTESHFEGAFGDDVITYFYKFGYVRFDPLEDNKYTLSMIVIDKPEFKAIRNIEVSDDIDSVIQKFPYNNKSVLDSEGRKYLYGKFGENCGFVTYDKTGKIISIIYRYGDYTLWMTVSNNKIASIKLAVTTV